MLLRNSLTALSLVASYLAYLVMGCASLAFVWPPADPYWVCYSTEVPGAVPGTYLAAGVWGTSFLVVAGAWTLTYIRTRSRDKRANDTLAENLGRVGSARENPEVRRSLRLPPSPAATLPTQETAEAETHGRPPAPEEPPAVALRREVESMEASATSGSMSPADWIMLLKRVNSLHNDAKLDSDDFKKLNTRLLDLVGHRDVPKRTVDSARVEAAVR